MLKPPAFCMLSGKPYCMFWASPDGFLLPYLQKQVDRGLGLLHAQSRAMVRTLWGVADRDAALQHELANVEEVLANIKNKDLPYNAIGSFVNILGVRQTASCASGVAS